jgi:N-dimethylarginine dimethylaminohydrolase
MIATSQYISSRKINYGIDNGGALKTVIMHTPQIEEDSQNCDNDTNESSIQEHIWLCDFFRSFGVEVIQLRDLVVENADLLPTLPDLVYPGFTAVVCRAGAFMSRHQDDIRRKEEFVISESLRHLSIPIKHEFQNTKGYFEGFIPYDHKTVFLTAAAGCRRDIIITFIQNALMFFDDIIELSLRPHVNHTRIDTIFNVVRKNCAMYCPSCIESTKLYRRYITENISIEDYCRRRNIEMIAISEDEQNRNGCAFVAVNNYTIAHFDAVLYEETVWKLKNKNINLVTFKSSHLQPANNAMSSYVLPVYRSLN